MTASGKPTHFGHRDRVRGRFVEQGMRAFRDYEILELLLFYVIPRRDTKPLAHILVDEFGSLGGVLRATEEALCRIPGVGERTAHFLASLLPLAEYVTTGEPFPASYASADDLGRFFVDYYREEKGYSVEIALMNSRCEIIKLIHVGNRTLTTYAELVCDIIVVAHDYNASFVAVAYHKPSGIPIPNMAEIELTRELYFALKDSALQLLENIFVAGNQFNPMLHYMEKHAMQDIPNGFSALRGSRSRRAPTNDLFAPSLERLTEILAYALPRASVQHVAEDLLHYFSSLSILFSFTCERLAEEKGMNLSAAILLKIVNDLCSRVAIEQILAEHPLCDTEDKMGQMFLRALSGLDHEVCAVALLDEKLRVLDFRIVAEGTAGMVHIKDGALMRIALRSRAPYIALAHNHPGGIALPSPEDFASTASIMYQFRSTGVRVVEHFVVTNRQYSAICTYGEVQGNAPEGFYADTGSPFRYTPDL